MISTIMLIESIFFLIKPIFLDHFNNKLFLFSFFNALFIKFKYYFLYWAHYNFYYIKIYLFLIENIFKIKKNVLIFSISISSLLLGGFRSFSGKAEKNSQQCASIIKLKTSKLYGCRCPYKVKSGIFCEKHKKVENRKLLDSKTKFKRSVITKNKLQCIREGLNDNLFYFQNTVKIDGSSIQKPLKPFLKWAGGKQDLLVAISKKIPKTFNNYYEPFLGGGSVLFHILYLRLQNKIVIKGNVYAYDINKQLINVYCVIQKKSEALYICLESYSQQYLSKNSIEEKKRYYLIVRERYNKVKVTDVEHAAMFIFLNKTCFRGLYRVGPNGFNVPFGNYNKPNINFDKENLVFLSVFIKDVIFKHDSFEIAFQNCKKGDFIYLDPPYVPDKASSFLRYTKEHFTIEQHIFLFKLTKGLSKRSISFLMSNSRTTFVLNFFKEFCIEDVLAKRRINGKSPNSKKLEVLITYKGVNSSFNRYREGFLFEKEFSLSKHYNIKLKYTVGINYEVIIFKGRCVEFVRLEKSWFLKYMVQQNFIDKDIKHARGCMYPDEAFLNGLNLYILEKKIQTIHGSVDEKLQTALFKLEHYRKLYPRHRVIYIYCLADWFKKNCPAEIDYLNKNNIPVFWFSDSGWTQQLIKLLHGETLYK